MRRAFSITYFMTVGLISIAMLCSCNAGIDLPEITTSQPSSVPSNQKQQLTYTQTNLVPFEADSNIEFSVLKDSRVVDLSSEDKLVFELRNNTMEIVSLSKLEEKQDACPSRIKANLKKDLHIICNSYIKKQNLTDIIVFLGETRYEVSSWIFEEDQNSDLIKLKIKLR